MNNDIVIDTKPIIAYKEELLDEDFIIEFQVLPAYDATKLKDARRNNISEAISAIDVQSFY